MKIFNKIFQYTAILVAKKWTNNCRIIGGFATHAM